MFSYEQNRTHHCCRSGSRNDEERCRKAVKAVIDVVSGALAKGEKVQLIGFGTFEVRERKAREGHNPSTQEVIKIPASKTPAFRVSKQLKEKVNVKPAKKTRAKKAAKK